MYLHTINEVVISRHLRVMALIEKTKIVTKVKGQLSATFDHSSVHYGTYSYQVT